MLNQDVCLRCKRDRWFALFGESYDGQLTLFYTDWRRRFVDCPLICTAGRVLGSFWHVRSVPPGECMYLLEHVVSDDAGAQSEDLSSVHST